MINKLLVWRFICLFFCCRSFGFVRVENERERERERVSIHLNVKGAFNSVYLRFTSFVIDFKHGEKKKKYVAYISIGKPLYFPFYFKLHLPCSILFIKISLNMHEKFHIFCTHIQLLPLLSFCLSIVDVAAKRNKKRHTRIVPTNDYLNNLMNSVSVNIDGSRQWRYSITI